MSALVFLSFVLPGWAQTPPAKPELPQSASVHPPTTPAQAKATAVEETALTATQRISVELLREAGDEAGAVKEKFRSAMLQAKVADRLWRYDKEAARKLFEDAFAAAEQYVKDGERTAQANAKLKRDTTRQQDVRMVVIRLYTRHDEAAGKRLLERYLSDKKQERWRRSFSQSVNDQFAALLGNERAEIDEMLAAAIAMLEINRPLAVQIAQQAMQQSASPLASQFFYALASADRNGADTLFVQVLANVNRFPLQRPGTLFALAPYAFGERAMYVTDGASVFFNVYQVPQNYQPSAAVAAAFLQAALTLVGRFAEPNAAQRSSTHSILAASYFFVLRYESQAALFAPAMSQSWQAMKSRLAGLAQDEARNSIEAALQRNADQQNEMSAGGDDVPTLLQRAAHARDFATRDKLYQQAAFALMKENDFGEALTVARKITTHDYRRRTESWINFEAAANAYKEEKFDEARKYAEEVVEPDWRAYALFQTAAAALKKDDRSLAGEIARQAATAAENASASINKAHVTLGIAFVYEDIEASRAFDYLSDAIKAINQLSEHDYYEAERDKIERVFPSPTGTLTQELTARGMSLAVTLPQLARHDGLRALSLARDCRDHATRAVALLSLGSMGLKE
jgi:hypothetical protein